MATVRKRTWGEGRVAWQVDYRDGAGVRRAKQFAKKKDAQAFLDQSGEELRRGVHTPARATITVAEAGELWLKQAELGHGDEPPLEKATVRQYEQHLELFIRPLLGATKLSELTLERITRFENELKERGRPLSEAERKQAEDGEERRPVSTAMVKKVVSSLGALLAVAQAHGKVSRNVVRERARERRRRGGRHKRQLEVGRDIPDRGELRAILEATGKIGVGRWRPLIVTAIFTGLRASELRGLRWQDADLDAGLIHVRQRVDRFNSVGPPKSATSRRDVPMTPMVVNVLKEWRLACPRPIVGRDAKGKPIRAKPAGEHLVFPNGAGKPESLSNIYRRGLGAVQKEAKLTKDADRPKYGLHAFRHAAASMFIEQGFTPKRVQALLGHASIQITFDRYGHLFPQPEDDAKAMAAIEQRLQAVG